MGCFLDGGLAFYTIFLVMLALPLLFFAIAAGATRWNALWNLDADLAKKDKNRNINTLMFAIFLIYPSLSYKTLQGACWVIHTSMHTLTYTDSLPIVSYLHQLASTYTY